MMAHFVFHQIANPAFHRSMPIELFGKLTKKMIYVMDQAKGPIEFHNMTSRITLDAIGLAGFGKLHNFSLFQ